MGKSLIHKKVSFGFITGGISLIVDGLVGLAILPLLIKFLSKEIAGLWVFFVSFSSLVMLGQAGLAPVVTRLTAGLKIKNFEDDDFWGLVSKAYRFVLLFVFIICFIVYVFYIKKVLNENSYLWQGSICWLFLTLGYMCRMFGIKYLHVINGLGEVGWDKMIQIVVAITTLVGYYIALFFKFELLGLGLVYLVSSVLFIILSRIAFEKFASQIKKNNIEYKLKELAYLFKESGKILVLNLTSFTVMQANIFIIERIIGLKILPYYTGLARIGAIIISVSGLYNQMIFPFIAQEYAANSHTQLRKLYVQSVIIAVAIGIILSICAFLAAPYVIPHWLGADGYLGNKIFVLILIFGLIYIHHVAHGNAVIATGQNTFVVPAIVNALLAIPFSILGGVYFGIEGILIGNILATILPSIYVVNYSLKFFKSLDPSKIFM